MKKETVYNQEVGCDEGFVEGEGYPNCDGQPCANMADAEHNSDTMTDQVSAEGDPSDEAAEWRDKFLRLQAEFDNYRKRTLREKMDLVQSGGRDVLLSMLTVRDDVQRAVDAMGKSDDIEALRAGVNLIALKFTETLRHKGVTEMDVIGQKFDADVAEAVAKFAAGDDKKESVIDVVQSGYMLGDKVLRFAKVVVGE